MTLTNPDPNCPMRFMDICAVMFCSDICPYAFALKVLDFYASHENYEIPEDNQGRHYPPDVMLDGGKRARKVLGDEYQ